MEEEWRWVIGYEGEYQISSFGRVRSIPRVVVMKNGITKTVHGRIRKLKYCQGYPKIEFTGHGKKGSTVHRLVAAAFLGPQPPGMEVRHHDSNPGNPRLDNLSYSTHKVNHSDRAANGTNNAGETNKASKITQEQALTVLALGRLFPHRTVGAQFGLSGSQVARIVSGENWRHLNQDILSL